MRVGQQVFENEGNAMVGECMVTSEPVDKHNGLCFVVGPADRLVLDLTRKLPGRMVWVKANRALLSRAIKESMFDHYFGKKVNVSNDYTRRVQDSLKKRALEQLSLACKAGSVVAGFDKISAFGESENVICLLQASDAGESVRRKLKIKSDRSVRRFTLFTREELGRSIGKVQVVHMAIKSSQIAQNLVQELDRYQGYVVDNGL